MIYWVYNALLTAAFIVGLLFLPLVCLWGERFRVGLLQRLGFYPREIGRLGSGSPSVLIHAASVGEVRCAGSLTHEFRKRFPEKRIIVSTFTLTGNLLARRITAADAVVFLPLDHPWVVRRALATLDPAILIVLETEIWPNLLRLAYRKGIPTVLLSGRLSSKAFTRYYLFRFFFRRVLQHLTAVGMQTEQDAERMIMLGVERGKISITGSLKHALFKQDGLQYEIGEQQQNQRRPAPLLVVGSSHNGEEEILLGVFAALKKSFPQLRMVLAPRHPQRFAEVEDLLKASGFPFDKRSDTDGRSTTYKDILLLDTIGELPHFYAIGDVAFVGGSLVNAGGHNLLEPAHFRKPILFGPYTANFAAVAAEMKQKGGGMEVRDRDDLIREISELLNEPERARAMGEKAYGVAEDSGSALEHSLALVSNYLGS